MVAGEEGGLKKNICSEVEDVPQSLYARRLRTYPKVIFARVTPVACFLSSKASLANSGDRQVCVCARAVFAA